MISGRVRRTCLSERPGLTDVRRLDKPEPPVVTPFLADRSELLRRLASGSGGCRLDLRALASLVTAGAMDSVVESRCDSLRLLVASSLDDCALRLTPVSLSAGISQRFHLTFHSSSASSPFPPPPPPILPPPLFRLERLDRKLLQS